MSSNKSPPEIGWKKDLLEPGPSNDDENNMLVITSRVRSRSRSPKCKKHHNRKHSSGSSSSSDSGRDSSSSSSKSASSADDDRKKLKKEKREKRREAKKLKKEEKRARKAQKKEMKKARKEKHREEKKMKKLAKKCKKDKPEEDVVMEASNFAVPLDLMYTKANAPETPEEYKARSSTIRRVVDPETGRTRIIKGDGEILEEIVTKDRHKEINKQATKGDGEFFQSKAIGWKE